MNVQHMCNKHIIILIWRDAKNNSFEFMILMLKYFWKISITNIRKNYPLNNLQ